MESAKKSYHHLYDRQWRQARIGFLKQNPLCVFCQRDGIVEEATVVDHIKPHRGDKSLFWDTSNWQALCSSCHSSRKQRIEIHGYDHSIGEDGWPVDDDHPVNRGRVG